MAITIKGPGGQHELIITDDGEASAFARINTEAQKKAKTGELFSITTYSLPLNDTNEKAVLWVQFSDPNKLLVLDEFNIYWNGGDTNKNRMVDVAYEILTTEPTVNRTAGAAIMTNTYLSNTLLSTIWIWNQTSTGLGGHTAGARVNSIKCGPGHTQQTLHGRYIFKSGTTFMLYAHPEEAGKLTFSAYVYTIDPKTMR